MKVKYLNKKLDILVGKWRKYVHNERFNINFKLEKQERHKSHFTNV